MKTSSEIVRSIRTEHAKLLRGVRTQDAMLTAVPPGSAEGNRYFASRAPMDAGKIWDGIRGGLDAIADPDARQAAVDAIRGGLEGYQLAGNAPWTVTGAGTAITDSRHFDTQRRRDSNTVAAMNAAARRIWNR